jgi:hypothetical protein
MIGTDVSADAPGDAGEKVKRGVRSGMEEAADAGFAVSFDEAPPGATNTLKHSGVQPTWEGNTLVWGFTADHARFVEEGTSPHWIPVDAMDEVEVWARRVLGNEGAAWAVRQTIAEQGTQAQEFVAKGIAEQQRVLEQRGIADKVGNEFE